MTPKEKALELWWKYYNRIERTLSEEYSPHKNFITKQCALIVVDEILSNDGFSSSIIEWNIFMSYWLEVKQEIEKL